MRPNPAIALFLDRDGVINQRIPDDYVKHPDEFIFIEKSLEALVMLAGKFHRIVIVTNQQGIGRGLMTTGQLEAVHQKMLRTIQEAGGRVDAVLFSPDLKNTNSFTRKPAIGMALEARNRFPEIRLERSVMVGDTCSDMLFGRRAGMACAWIGEDAHESERCNDLIDFRYASLWDFATNLPLTPCKF